LLFLALSLGHPLGCVGQAAKEKAEPGLSPTPIPEETGDKALRSILQTLVERELEAWRGGDEEEFYALLDSAPENKLWFYDLRYQFRVLHGLEKQRTPIPPHIRRMVKQPYRPVVEVVERHGDWAWASVLLDNPDSTLHDFRISRFYRLVDGLWLHTSPYSAFWGERLERKTRYFRFTFHARDRDAVDYATGRLDELYASLLSDLGLPLSKEEWELEFFFVTRGRLRQADPHRVPSPLSGALPGHLSEGEGLLLWVGELLIADAVRRAMGGPPLGEERFLEPVPPRSDVRGLANGAQFWWLRRWVPLPKEMALERESLVRAWFREHDASLADVCQADHWYFGWPNDSVFPRETVAEYVAETYGPRALGEMLAATVRGLGCAEAAARVLDVSPEAFEAEWRAFVDSTY